MLLGEKPDTGDALNDTLVLSDTMSPWVSKWRLVLLWLTRAAGAVEQGAYPGKGNRGGACAVHGAHEEWGMEGESGG